MLGYISSGKENINNKYVMMKINLLIVGIISIILFIPTTSALADGTVKTDSISIQERIRAMQLSSKIKEARPNSKVTTINNKGMLIDVKKDSEGRVYLTEFNKDEPLIKKGEFLVNSCEFWVKAAVMTIGIVIFTALAFIGVDALLGFFATTLYIVVEYYDAALLVGGLLTGLNISFVSDWVAAKACGSKAPLIPKQPQRGDPHRGHHHWDGIPD